MEITETDPVFDNDLRFQMYPRRNIVLTLMGNVEEAPSIDGLERVSACGHADVHFTYNHICKLYFKPLGENRVRLLHFVFAVYGGKEPERGA